ncbi:hypothetical protein LCGC14_0394380 [marine sediment metagenome]|uniref:Uncharacterized protein n=1 Tax=marine sediment metagenome TaxID=412755 RepID=A0A0F9W7R8_9ZZZZ
MTERKLTAEDIAMIAGWINPYRTHLADLIHDLGAAEAELGEYKKGYWGNPCEKHHNVEAWVAGIKKDAEGLHCFGCFLEARSLPEIEALEAEVERLQEALEEKEAEIAEYRERITNIKNQAFTALERPKIREAAKGAPSPPGPPKPPRVKGDRPQG